MGDDRREPNPTDFVIAESKGGLATKICFVIDDLSSLIGSLRSGCAHKVSPGRGGERTFGVTSLQGSYAGLLITRGGRGPVAVVGLVTFNGGGTFTTDLNANVPPVADPTAIPGPFPGRVVETLMTSGRYRVNADGTCTMVGAPPPGESSDPTHCVITEEQEGTATSVDICFDNATAPVGGLACGTATRQTR